MYQDDRNKISAGLLRVRTRFVHELNDKSLRLCELRSQIQEHEPNDEALKEIGQICHKMAGTASTLGFPDLGANASAIDGAIDQRAITCAKPSPNLLRVIDEVIAETLRIRYAQG